MTKQVFVLFFLLVLISCEPVATSTTCTETEESSDECLVTDPDENNEADKDPGTDTSDVPPEAALFDANISFFEFETEDEEKVNEAIEIIKKVIASQDFKDKVINFTYNGKKAFVDNNGLTNAQIYQTILDGREELRPDLDNQMDLELELYYSSGSTVGYTYPNEMRVWLNRKFFDQYTPSEVAGNIFHEWTHKLGFAHASRYSIDRDASVPYAIGYLIEELGKGFE